MKHLLTLLLLVCSFALVGCGSEPGPGDSVKDLMGAFEEGDAETIKELAPQMGMLGDDKLESMATQMALEAKKKGGIKSVDIKEETVDGDSATVKFVVNWGNGESEEEETAELAKLDGKWIMDMGDDADKPGGLGGGPSIDLGPGDFEIEEPEEE